MALSRKYQLYLKLAVISICFFSLTLLPSKTDSGGIKESTAENEQTILGSRPPGCVNKCMSCRPCEATLVIPTHKMVISSSSRSSTRIKGRGSFVKSSRREDDDTYYLLSWKCRCGNKYYHP
ncbi:hypothetical protein ABFX02_04G106600 [Erythranthe guttata]